jgi:hypothetical protein
MSHDDRGKEGLEVILANEGGMRKVHIAVKGPLSVFLVIFLSFFTITGYFWANSTEKPANVKIFEEDSLPKLNYRICYTIKKQRLSGSV